MAYVYMNVESEGMLWIGVSASWPYSSPRYPALIALSRRCCSSISGIACPFFPSAPSPCLLRRGSPIFVIDAFQRSCSVFLPRLLSAIYGIVGSHLPHYHTNRPLAHSDAAFILCPSHLRFAGDQPKSDPIHVRSFRRADRGSYELAREPLAWGTRRKSIILNHGVIGSNDQTTARRASHGGDSRGRTTSHLSMSRKEDPVFPQRRFSKILLIDSHAEIIIPLIDVRKLMTFFLANKLLVASHENMQNGFLALPELCKVRDYLKKTNTIFMISSASY